jgi:hypothetical protein
MVSSYEDRTHDLYAHVPMYSLCTLWRFSNEDRTDDLYAHAHVPMYSIEDRTHDRAVISLLCLSEPLSYHEVVTSIFFGHVNAVTIVSSA